MVYVTVSVIGELTSIFTMLDSLSLLFIITPILGENQLSLLNLSNLLHYLHYVVEYDQFTALQRNLIVTYLYLPSSLLAWNLVQHHLMVISLYLLNYPSS